jgi:hypothetical protein
MHGICAQHTATGSTFKRACSLIGRAADLPHQVPVSTHISRHAISNIGRQQPAALLHLVLLLLPPLLLFVWLPGGAKSYWLAMYDLSR